MFHSITRTIYVKNKGRTNKKNSTDLLAQSQEALYLLYYIPEVEVNTEKTKYTLLSRHQNAGQNQDIKIGNMS
jgi:hypothetical protein